jgi:hypothetical protein
MANGVYGRIRKRGIGINHEIRQIREKKGAEKCEDEGRRRARGRGKISNRGWLEMTKV